MKNKNKKNLIIGILSALVIVMAVGYAAFATNLDITGTTSIDSRWDVKILSITPDKTATNTGTEQAPVYTTPGDIAHSITNNDLTANFSTALISPGDTVTYEVVVKNNGTLNAKLISLVKTDTNNPAISFAVSGIAENDVLEANASKTITIVVTYVNNTNGQGQPASTTSELGITLNFVQTNDSAAVTTTNGGGNSNVINGLTIDQTFVPQYYEFHLGNYSDYDSRVDLYDTADIQNWTEDPTTLNKSYYLGHDVDNTGKVSANYACFIVNNTQYCMKGNNNNSYIIGQNNTLLGALAEDGIISCSTTSTSNASCSSDNLGYIVSYNIGSTTAGPSSSMACSAGYFGGSYCYVE